MNKLTVIIFGIISMLSCVILLAYVSILQILHSIKEWMHWFTDQDRPGNM